MNKIHITVTILIMLIVSVFASDLPHPLDFKGTDTEYQETTRTYQTVITYWDGFDGCPYETPNIYWGYVNGTYYYYGRPHLYQWYYYYDKCPPIEYNRNKHKLWHAKFYNKKLQKVIVRSKKERE